MTWLFRFGVCCALLSVSACTGNPKPLPPNNVEDGSMQDSSVQQDANVQADSSTPDAAPPLDGGDDAAVDGGDDAAVDGAL